MNALTHIQELWSSNTGAAMLGASVAAIFYALLWFWLR